MAPSPAAGDADIPQVAQVVPEQTTTMPRDESGQSPHDRRVAAAEMLLPNSGTDSEWQMGD